MEDSHIRGYFSTLSDIFNTLLPMLSKTPYTNVVRLPLLIFTHSIHHATQFSELRTAFLPLLK
jgi:hypothetical protein